MSHRCVSCGRVAGKNSRALLDGCPDCGCKKFTYQPSKGKPTTGKRATTVAGVKAELTAQNGIKQASDNRLEEIGMASFESIRLVEEGTYVINLKNILAQKHFVLGLEDGCYIIPFDEKPSK